MHSGYTDLDFVDIEPNTLNLGSQGKTVRSWFQLPSEYDPHQILLQTVSINEQVFPNSKPITIVDDDGDGVEEMILKFNRADLEAVLTDGESVALTLTGEVQNKTWFSGTDHIRVIRPQLTHPNGGEYFVTGDNVTITWSPPDWNAPVTYDLILSRDGGNTWETLASGLTGLSYSWTAGGPPTTDGLLRVMASDNQGVLGYDTSNNSITIADVLHAPHAVGDLSASTDGVDLVLTWSIPPTDLLHGPAASYRILVASDPGGPFIEMGTSILGSFRRGLNADNGPMTHYRVISENAAGESAGTP